MFNFSPERSKEHVIFLQLEVVQITDQEGSKSK